MNLLAIVLTLVVVAVLLWAILTYIPMPAPFPKLITALVVIVCVVWLLQVTGLWGYLGNVKIR